MSSTAPARSADVQRLLNGAILPTLLKLAGPNVLAMAMQVLVGIAETIYIGRLGTTPLAAIALVFPFLMLAHQLSAGAMGGGVSSAVSRALGAADGPRANALAMHSLVIGGLLGLVFMLTMLLAGPTFYRWLGGDGEVLAMASAYSSVLFLGALMIWLSNTLASVIRGSGNMRVPSAGILASALLQVVLGGVLAFGWGPIPAMGMLGVAVANIVAITASVVYFVCYLLGTQSRIRLSWSKTRFELKVFWDILRVGAISMVSPLQSVLAVLLMTAFVARLGEVPLAGYAIGQRLEFLLVPISFGVGVAALPMVGMAIGAGQVGRARRVAWTAGLTSAVNLGLIGLLVLVAPGVWSTWFSEDPSVLAHGRMYLQTVGPAFAMFGLGVTLYFASQGSGKVLGPVLAGTVRLLVIAGVGTWLFSRPEGASAQALFVLIAASMTVYGLTTALSVKLTRWG